MKSSRAFVLAITLCCVSSALAQVPVSFVPAGDESSDFQTEVLLADLDNPTGIALRPTHATSGPYELYFAESGAGRVLRVATNALEQVDEVLVDFPLGTLGQRPEYRVGPLGLAFISRTKLVVSSKGESPGADVLASFTLPSDDSVLTAAEQDHAVGPLKAELAAQVDDLQFGELVMADRMCFLTTGGQKGWVLKSGIEANRLAYLQPFIDLQKKVGYGAPAGIALIPHPRPAFLVVALMGSRDTPQDSRLTFFVPSSGELAMNLPTGLHDIISLAYSPTGQLYAADFSWHDAQAGGVYRIDDARLDGRQTCRAVKIASIVRPFSLAFAPDGSLFVTALGEGDNTKQGTLVKITGEL
ncbi:MAG: hypothetical protein GXP24_09305 [Planctomycetes bacterium]|nr:hypothetical protein [Planctomycetota bacterium]